MSSAAYFTHLADQIALTNSCAELQATVNQVAATLQAQKDAINSQIALIAPLAALLTPPVDPPAAVTWIASLINDVLAPMYAPYAIYSTQLTELAAAYATLGTAINDAASRIGSCDIDIPPLT